MAIIDDFDGFLIDLDGVVYVGNTLVPGASETIRTLRERDKHVLFLTNDPRSSKEDYASKLRRLGLAVTESEVLTSGAATAAFIVQHEPTASSAFVIGTEALKQELRDVGLAVVEGDDGRHADVVVVGGHDGLTYDELRIGSQAVGRGAGFYGTGRDPTFPMPDGPWPATGAVLAAVETAGGRPARVIGKPDPAMFRVAQQLLPEAQRYVVIGDRLDSDIAGGRGAGLATVLVLSGSTSEAEAAAASPPPDFTIPDLRGLLTDRQKSA